MIITVIISRTPAQQLQANARWWVVGGAGDLIASSSCDPGFGLTAADALRLGLEALLRDLDSRRPAVGGERPPAG